MNFNPIIIDTDPGIDDALAIFLANKLKMNVLGYTTVFGNAAVKYTTLNAAYISDVIDSEKVYMGESAPLLGEPRFASSHGENGFGKIIYTDNDKLGDLSAIEFYKSKLLNSKLTIVALGPLTNLARFVTLYPNLIQNIEKIVIMGGVINAKGNITQYAEFNFYNDPLAAKQVLDLDVPKVLIPADICRKIYMSNEDFKLIESNLDVQSSKVLADYIDYYLNNSLGNPKGGVLYDVLTILYLYSPEDFKTSLAHVDIVIDTDRKGMSILNKNSSDNFYNCQLVTDLNISKLKRIFMMNFRN